MALKRSRSDSVSSVEDPNSPFSREASVHVKIVHLDSETALSTKPAVMKCLLPPHQPLEFTSFEDYDVHYSKTHLNRCTECHKNFPDEHFLHLHIAENHDPITAAKKDRGEKTYACLIPTCDRLCSTPQKRRLHCIDKHSFPRNYDFFVVNDGIDRRSSMLRPPHRRRSSTLTSTTGTGSHRRRSSTMGSVTGATEGMDIVKDEDDDGDVHIGEEEEEEVADQDNPQSPQRGAPLKLHGRGGFGHGKRGGRGRGRGIRSGETVKGGPSAAKSIPSSSGTGDAMEGLTSGLSALQFVPHSVRVAQGGGGA